MMMPCCPCLLRRFLSPKASHVSEGVSFSTWRAAHVSSSYTLATHFAYLGTVSHKTLRLQHILYRIPPTHSIWHHDHQDNFKAQSCHTPRIYTYVAYHASHVMSHDRDTQLTSHTTHDIPHMTHNKSYCIPHIAHVS